MVWEAHRWTDTKTTAESHLQHPRISPSLGTMLAMQPLPGPCPSLQQHHTAAGTSHYSAAHMGLHNEQQLPAETMWCNLELLRKDTAQIIALMNVSVCVLSCVWLFVTPWTVDHQAPLSMGFSRILEWVAISSSRESSQPRDWTCISCIGRWILYHWATWKAY